MKRYVLEKKIDGSWFKVAPFKKKEVTYLANIAFLLGKWSICDDVCVIEEEDDET